MILPIINGKYEFTLPPDVNYTGVNLSCHPIIIDMVQSKFILFIPLRSINTITYVGKGGVTACFTNTGIKDYLVTDTPQSVYTISLPPPSESGTVIHVTLDSTNICFPPMWIS